MTPEIAGASMRKGTSPTRSDVEIGFEQAFRRRFEGDVRIYIDSQTFDPPLTPEDGTMLLEELTKLGSVIPVPYSAKNAARLGTFLDGFLFMCRGRILPSQDPEALAQIAIQAYGAEARKTQVMPIDATIS